MMRAASPREDVIEAGAGPLRHRRLDWEGRPLFETLRHACDLDLAASVTIIQAALADDREAAALGLALPAAVLRARQTTRLAGGEAVEPCASSFHGALFGLTAADAGRIAPAGLGALVAVQARDRTGEG